MDLFSLQTSIEVQIDNAIDNLKKLSLKASEVASQIKDGLSKNEIKVNPSNAINSYAKLSRSIESNRSKLELLKQKYQDVVIAEGKNSQSAKKLAFDINKLSSEINEDRQKLDEAKRAADQFDNSLDNLDSSSNKLASGGFTILKGAVANLVSSGIMRLVEGFKSLIGSAGSYQSQMEQYTTSFEVMTGSASKAAEVTKRLGEVAASTPFEMTDLADTTQLLMNYGFTADDAISRMQMLGDISQGSSEKMTRIATAYGQMSSAGKVSLEDVKQMIEAGFNPLQEISQTTGESMSSLYSRISKGTITVDEITASMQRSTAEGGKYFGSMDKQSQTLSGRLSTLRDTINSSLGTALSGILTKLADEILPKVTAAIESIDWEKVGNTLTSTFEKLINVGKWLVEHMSLVSTLVLSFGGASLAIGVFNAKLKLTEAVMKSGTIANTLYKLGLNATSKSFSLATLSANLFNKAIGVITKHPIIALITALVGVLVVAYNTNEDFRKTVNKLAKDILSSLKPVLESLKPVFAALMDVLKALMPIVKTVFNVFIQHVTNMINIVKPILMLLLKAFSTVFSAMAKVVTPVIKVIAKIIEVIGKAVSSVTSGIGKIKKLFNFKWELPKLKLPKFSIKPSGWKIGDLLKGSIPKLGITWNAEGAIFNKPAVFDTPYGLQGVGEAGAEAVTPIDKLEGYVRNVVQEENEGLAYRLDTLIDMFAEYMPVLIKGQNKKVVLDSGVLVGQMANQMDVKLSSLAVMKERGN